jgi:anthranilate synthase/aminodeoxychorismate synthase-like glutamine amidotransferase
VRVLFIDNPGFTYNLVAEFEKRDCEVLVYGADTDMNVLGSVIKKLKPKLIVVSGYGNMKNAGNSVEVIMKYHGQLPIFGVGFGCGCIIEAFEGKVDRSPVINHGKIIKVNHDDKTIFKKINNPFNAGVYSSLSASDVPYDLEVSARNENDIVMGVRHKECFVEGIQFDPGSLLTADGSLIIENLLNEIGKK